MYLIAGYWPFDVYERRRTNHTPGRRSSCSPTVPVAILAFTVLSRLTVGSWLVTGGFFEIDQSMYQQPTS